MSEKITPPELDNLLALHEQLLPKAPEATRIDLETQQKLVAVALRLANYIREIHYWHEHECKKAHSDSRHCLASAYQYIRDIGA